MHRRYNTQCIVTVPGGVCEALRPRPASLRLATTCNRIAGKRRCRSYCTSCDKPISSLGISVSCTRVVSHLPSKIPHKCTSVLPCGSCSTKRKKKDDKDSIARDKVFARLTGEDESSFPCARGRHVFYKHVKMKCCLSFLLSCVTRPRSNQVGTQVSLAWMLCIAHLKRQSIR